LLKESKHCPIKIMQQLITIRYPLVPPTGILDLVLEIKKFDADEFSIDWSA
jgi:hypothetical protein